MVGDSQEGGLEALAAAMSPLGATQPPAAAGEPAAPPPPPAEQRPPAAAALAVLFDQLGVPRHSGLLNIVADVDAEAYAVPKPMMRPGDGASATQLPFELPLCPDAPPNNK